jgi:rhodanese-related sulfurtransferase
VNSRPTVTVGDAAARVAAGTSVLDVREPAEFAVAHIAGASLIPLGELPDRVAEVPTGVPVIVVCRSGNRSGVATDALRSAGRDAWNLQGGMNAWIAAGLPTAGC